MVVIQELWVVAVIPKPRPEVPSVAHDPVGLAGRDVDLVDPVEVADVDQHLGPIVADGDRVSVGPVMAKAHLLVQQIRFIHVRQRDVVAGSPVPLDRGARRVQDGDSIPQTRVSRFGLKRIEVQEGPTSIRQPIDVVLGRRLRPPIYFAPVQIHLNEILILPGRDRSVGQGLNLGDGPPLVRRVLPYDATLAVHSGHVSLGV